MTMRAEAPLLDRLRAETADLVVQYLDSTTLDAEVSRTATIARIAGAVTGIGERDESAGTSWELVEAWETAHRVVQSDRERPCPCGEHTRGSGVTVENLARLVNRISPDTDLSAAIAAIDDEARTPRPEGSRELVNPAE